MPYYGETEKTFNHIKNKSVILISGMNMEGKTSFLNSIRWCLYGKALGRKSREIPDNDLLNTLAHSKGDSEVTVRLNFEHDGKTYELIRSMSFPNGLSDSPDLSNYLKINGSQVSPQNIDKEIASIMSYDVSRFFLFDGELLDQYEDLLDDKKDSVEKIKSDIEKILGIPAVIKASKSLQYLKEEATKSMAASARKKTQLQSYAENLKFELDKKDQIKKSIEKLEKNKDEAQKEEADLEEFISQHESKIKISDQVDAIGKQINTYKIDKDNKRNQLSEESQNIWKSPLASHCQALKEEVRTKVKDAELISKTFYKKKTLNELFNDSLSAGKCELCDSTLSKKEIAKIEGKIISTKEALEELSFDEDAKLKLEEEEKIYNEIILENRGDIVQQIENDIEDLKIKIHGELSKKTKLEKQIRSLDTSQIKRKRDDLTKCKVDIKKTEELLENSYDDLKKSDAIIDRLQQLLKDKGALTGSKLHDTLSILEKVFSRTIDTLRSEYKKNIESEASKTFCNLTSDSTYKGLRINKSYGLRIIDKNGNEVKQRSAGAEHVVSLSLLNGLNKSSNSKAPIIMDTPFGRLDSVHTNSIINFLGDFGEQLFLLTQDKEIDPNNVPNALALRMNTHLRIEKISSDWSKIQDN